jgi:hypothetical protein
MADCQTGSARRDHSTKLIFNEIEDTDTASDPFAGSLPPFELGGYAISIWLARFAREPVRRPDIGSCTSASKSVCVQNCRPVGPDIPTEFKRKW